MKKNYPEISTNLISVNAQANIQFTLKHNFGRIPAGWLVVYQDNPTDVYLSGVIDSNVIQLTATQSAAIKLLLL